MAKEYYFITYQAEGVFRRHTAKQISNKVICQPPLEYLENLNTKHKGGDRVIDGYSINGHWSYVLLFYSPITKEQYQRYQDMEYSIDV